MLHMRMQCNTLYPRQREIEAEIGLRLTSGLVSMASRILKTALRGSDLYSPR